MGKFRDEIAAKSKAIADRWAARTKEDLTRKLTAADIDAIFAPLLKKGRTLTAPEGEAMLLLLQQSKFEDLEAINSIRKLVREAIFAGKWGVPQLKTDVDLELVFRALSHAVVGTIIFKSPGTKLTYSPAQYYAVKSAIRDQKVMVFQLSDGLQKFLPEVAIYHIGNNVLILKEPRSSDKDAHIPTIVHECTHVIQDWTNSRALRKYAEADGYIASALSAIAIDKKFIIDNYDENFPSFTKAARLIRSGKADESNKEWQATYEEVVFEMEALVPDADTALSHTGETSNEAEIFADLLLWAERADPWTQIRNSQREYIDAVKKIDLEQYARPR